MSPAKCNNQDRHTKKTVYHRDYLSPWWVCALAFEALWALMLFLIIPQAASSQSQRCCSLQIGLQTRHSGPQSKYRHIRIMQSRSFSNACHSFCFLRSILSLLLFMLQMSVLLIIFLLSQFPLFSLYPFSLVLSPFHHLILQAKTS